MDSHRYDRSVMIACPDADLLLTRQSSVYTTRASLIDLSRLLTLTPLRRYGSSLGGRLLNGTPSGRRFYGEEIIPRSLPIEFLRFQWSMFCFSLSRTLLAGGHDQPQAIALAGSHQLV